MYTEWVEDMGRDGKDSATKDFYAQLKGDIRTDFYDLREWKDTFEGISFTANIALRYLPLLTNVHSSPSYHALE